MTASSNPAAPSCRTVVLITDNEAAIRVLIGRIVTRSDLIPVLAGNETAALNAVQEHRAHLACAIVGSLKPSMNAVALANAIQQVAPELPLILLSSLIPLPSASWSSLRLFGFLLKPFAVADLHGLLQRLVQRGSACQISCTPGVQRGRNSPP